MSLRVVLRPSDFHGCGWYRLLLPGATLHDAGELEVVVDTGNVLEPRFVERAGGLPELVGVEPVDADVVVLQRPLLWWSADAIEHLRAQGVAVVVEVDDDFESLHADHVNACDIDPAHNPAHNHEHLRRACRAADLVTVTTPALASRYDDARRVVVVPNAVPGAYLRVASHAPGSPLRIGWSGDPAVHPGDLEATGGGVGRAVEWAHAAFAIVGPGAGARAALGLSAEPEATGWVPFEEYAVHLARHDVGVVPLASTPFNQAKSWLKGLEMAALGVPFVASPTAEYRRLAALGAGVLAASPSAWKAEVTALAAREDLRVERAAQARAVAAEHTIEGHAWRWAEAWHEAALRRARGRHPAASVTLTPAPPAPAPVAAVPTVVPEPAPVVLADAVVLERAAPVLQVLVLAGPEPAPLLSTLSSIVDDLGEQGYRVVIHAPTAPGLDELLAALEGDVIVLRADVPATVAVPAMVAAAGPGEVVALHAGERLADVRSANALAAPGLPAPV